MLISMNQAVTIREVNQHTSAVFRRVREGEELIVTHAGQPQARIIPFRPRGRYEELAAEGRITPATTRGVQITRTYSVPVDVDDLVDADRAERDLL